MRQVAVNICRARTELGLTQEQFAHALKVTTSCVQGWESRTNPRYPRRRHLERLCELSGHGAHWFFLEHGDESSVAA